MGLFDNQLPKSKGSTGGQKSLKWANTASDIENNCIKIPGKLVLYKGLSNKAIKTPVTKLWTYLMANYLYPGA